MGRVSRAKSFMHPKRVSFMLCSGVYYERFWLESITKPRKISRSDACGFADAWNCSTRCSRFDGCEFSRGDCSDGESPRRMLGAILGRAFSGAENHG